MGCILLLINLKLDKLDIYVLIVFKCVQFNLRCSEYLWSELIILTCLNYIFIEILKESKKRLNIEKS